MAIIKMIVKSRYEVAELINKNLDIQRLLTQAAPKNLMVAIQWRALLGHGDAFVMRDPSSIRPAYYYCDDEVAVVCSERPAIQTAFNIHITKVHELPGGHAFIIKKDGRI